EQLNDLQLEQRPMPPDPKENQVLIRMGSVGICGSDVHYLVHGQIGDFVVKGPMVLGHESSGTVEKLGPCVKDLKEGDRVALEPGTPCRMCSYCKEGRYHLCPDVIFCATPPVDGTMCRYYVHTADFCHKLPDSLTLEDGALLEPLSVAVHACRRANLSCGTRVLIVGAGPIGLATICAARAYGAVRIVITDLNTHRLEIAKKLGVDATVRVCEGMEETQIAAEVQCQLGGPAHVTIECCGTESSIKQGLLATRYGGTFVLVGVGTDNARLPLTPIFHEVRFIGSFRYSNACPRDLCSFGQPWPTNFITSQMTGLSEDQEALTAEFNENLATTSVAMGSVRKQTAPAESNYRSCP
ncbi:sorbitol dehydrogenase-like, partial [Schistocerca serialis cubense]|uniref:sorbitol dehydrogenase-like n=1 Tax=Schistocerca serialis cubense TaxID=2023355 RepID=UPI00214E77ED